MSDPRTLIESIARQLVDRPDAVEVFEHPERGGVRFQVEVDPDDVGRVVGRQGRTVRAIRTLLRLAGDVDRTRYHLDVEG